MIKTLIAQINWRQWDLLRVLRVVLGISFFFSGMGAAEYGMAVLGGLVFLQGALNVGCGCAPGGTCAPTRQTEATEKQEVEYEVVE